MRVKRQTKFILAVSLQVVIILIIVGFKLAVLGGGNEIVLKVIPLDPRDVLRGDYVSFQYTISILPVSWLGNQAAATPGQNIYVGLRRTSSGYWEAYRASLNKLIAKSGEVVIKGTISQINRSVFAPMGLVENSTTKRLYTPKLSVVYGIEDYYIPEGRGRNIDFWDKKVLAKVQVDDDGRAVLEQIYVDGQAWP